MESTHEPSSLRRLPLVTLYVTERCNSRCVTCDYWRSGRTDMTLASLQGLLPDLARLQTRIALISGGEPLLNPDWASMATLLSERGITPWLLTSGLSLAKHARRAAQLFATITVSMDGTRPSTYAAIRGLDAFDKVCEGIRAAVDSGADVSLRVTLQRANYQELADFVALGRRLGARQVSFLAVDVANPHAFGRTDDFARDAALRPEDLPVFERMLESLERSHAEEFRRGFIAESPSKLRRLHRYFAAVQGLAPYPPVHCNAPEFSAVVGVKGGVQPCFFIAGPQVASDRDGLEDALNAPDMRALRTMIRAGKRPECLTCVCSMWRDLKTLDASLLPLRAIA